MTKQKFEIGQQVRIMVGLHRDGSRDTGIVQELSTWGEVNQHHCSDEPCYRVFCQTWDNGRGASRWFGETVLEAVA